MSLGSDYGPPDDPDAMAIDRAVQLGVARRSSPPATPVTATTSAAPRATRPRGIGVAATNDGYGVFDGWQVSPRPVSSTAPGPGCGRSPTTRTTKGDITGDLVNAPAGNEDACAPLPAGSATGKILR